MGFPFTLRPTFFINSIASCGPPYQLLAGAYAGPGRDRVLDLHGASPFKAGVDEADSGCPLPSLLFTVHRFYSLPQL